jgi:hypothetical protein
MVSLTNVAAANPAGSGAGGASENSVAEVNYAPSNPRAGLEDGTLLAQRGAGQLPRSIERRFQNRGAGSNVLQLPTNTNLVPFYGPLKSLPTPTQQRIKAWNNKTPGSTLQTNGSIITVRSPAGLMTAVGVHPNVNILNHAEETLYDKAIHQTRNLTEEVIPGTGYTKGDFIELMQARGAVENGTPTQNNTIALDAAKQKYEAAVVKDINNQIAANRPTEINGPAYDGVNIGQQRNGTTLQTKSPAAPRPSSKPSTQPQTPHDAILRGIPGAGPDPVIYPPVGARNIPNTSGPYTDLNKPPLTPEQEKKRDDEAIADQNKIRDQLAAGRNYGPDPFSPEEQDKRDRGNGVFNIPKTDDGFGAPASTSRALAQKPVPAPPALNVIGNGKPAQQAKPPVSAYQDSTNRDIANYRKGQVPAKELASQNPTGFKGEAIGNLNKITKSLTPADVQKILKSPVNDPLNSSQIKALRNGFNSTATNLGKGDVLIATGIRNSNNQYVSVKLHPDKKGAIAEAKPQGKPEGDNNILPFERYLQTYSATRDREQKRRPFKDKCELRTNMEIIDNKIVIFATVQAFRNGITLLNAPVEINLNGNRIEYVNQKKIPILNSAVPQAPADSKLIYNTPPALSTTITEKNSGRGITNIHLSRPLAATDPFVFLEQPGYKILGTDITLDINPSKLKPNSNLHTVAKTEVKFTGACSFDGITQPAMSDYDGATQSGSRLATKTGAQGTLVTRIANQINYKK